MNISHTRAGASAGLDTRMSTAGNADMSAFAHSLTHIGRAIAFAGLSSILMGASVTLGANTAWAGEASPQSLAPKEAKKPQAPEAKKEVAPRASETKETAGKSAPELKKEVAQPVSEPKKAKTESTLEAKPAPKQGKGVNQTVQPAAMEVRAPKPAPQQTPAAQTTELKVSLCWETMNEEYAGGKNAFVKGDSDFGQLNFGQWDFGSTLDDSRKDVKDAFGKIQFQIKDKSDNDKIVATTAGTYDPDTATSATKSLGSYDSTHTYEVSVVNSTIPSPYYVTYNNVSADEGKEFEGDVYHFKWTPSNGKDKQSQNKYFRLCVLEVVYAKDESVADKCFSYEQPKNADGSYRSDGNWKFSYNANNIFARLRVKDNKIQFPTDENGKPKVPVKAGYKFAGWQFHVARKTNGKPYTSFDRMFDDDQKKINSTTPAYSPFGVKPFIDYPYLFALIRDSKGVNTFGSKLGTQYCSTNHTFVVFPKWEASGYKVTFMNGDTKLAEVKVQENKSIDGDEWTSESMPAAPTEDNKDFAGWNTAKDGKGDAFTKDWVVKSDMTVYAQFKDKVKPKPKPKPEPMPTPTPTPGPQPGPYYPLPEPTPVPDVPAPAPTPEPEHKVPAIEAPTPTVPAEAPAPIARKRPHTLPQTSDPMTISAVGELGMILGVEAASLAAALRRKRRTL